MQYPAIPPRVSTLPETPPGAKFPSNIPLRRLVQLILWPALARQPSLFPLLAMKFIVLDTCSICGVKLVLLSQFGLNVVAFFEPKRKRAGPGSLFSSSAVGSDIRANSERFAMRPFSHFFVLQSMRLQSRMWVLFF